MTGPTLLFGASSLGEGEFQDGKAEELLEWLTDHGVLRFDTAALYPVSAPGKSEQALGTFQRDSEAKMIVDTKILVTDYSGKGTLAPDAISQSISASLSRLPGGISTLYCHIPDPETPVTVTAAALDRHHAEKHFEKLGLSNFQRDQVAAFIGACDEHQLVRPTMYQGQYNALSRTPERALMPLLRQHGLAFTAYSPLAGGFLTGNFTNGRNITGTRFDDTHPGAAMYKMQYDKPEMHNAIRQLEKACQPYQIGLSEAALRWLYHHSELTEGDGIILGATKMHQIQQNVEEIKRGPLPDDLVEQFDVAWKGACPGS